MVVTYVQELVRLQKLTIIYKTSAQLSHTSEA